MLRLILQIIVSNEPIYETTKLFYVPAIVLLKLNTMIPIKVDRDDKDKVALNIYELY